MSPGDMWSKGSRRTGASPDEVPFAPRRWPLKPRAKVPKQDPTDAVDEVNPSRDKSASGGSSSGIHGRGRGRSGCDTSIPSDDITTDPRTRNEHHCDDSSEPEESQRKDVEKRSVRGIRSRRRSERGRTGEQMAAEGAEQQKPPPPPEPTAQVHSAAAVRMDMFEPDSGARLPRFPGTTPLRYITPSKRSRAGLGSARSRTLPGPKPVTSPLPCPGCQNRD